jgi:hypothetical protein
MMRFAPAALPWGTAGLAVLLLALAGCPGGGSPDGVEGGAEPDAAADRPAPTPDLEPDSSASAPDGPPSDAGSDLELGPDSSPLTEARSFAVQTTLTLTADGASIPPLSPVETRTLSLTIRIDPADRSLLVGQSGAASRVPYSSADGVTFQATAPVSLQVPGLPCGGTALLRTFTVTVRDGVVTGTAAGESALYVEDQGLAYRTAVTMSGQRDSDPPSFSIQGGDQPVDPLGALTLLASEPLAASTTARLVSGLGSQDLVPILSAGGAAVVGFSQPARALLYDTHYDLVVMPYADLAGNPGSTTLQITTIAPPPLANEDGFEGTAPAGVSTVDATVIPPISGLRSAILQAGPAGLLLVRLARAPGDRVVRVTVRLFGSFAGSSAVPPVMLAVPGGPIVTAVPPPDLGELFTQQAVGPSLSTQPVWMGPARTLEMTIPEGAGPELVFQAGPGRQPAGCGPSPWPPGMLIDDLRAE